MRLRTSVRNLITDAAFACMRHPKIALFVILGVAFMFGFLAHQLFSLTYQCVSGTVFVEGSYGITVIGNQSICGIGLHFSTISGPSTFPKI